MNQWFQFLFGTPRRVLASLIALFVIISMIEPRIPIMLWGRLWCAFGPIVQQLLVLGVVIFGFRYMFRSFFGGGGGNNRRRH